MRTALVTGAGGYGIGWGVIKILHESGLYGTIVAHFGRDFDHQLYAEMNDDQNFEVIPVQGDFRTVDGIEKFIDGAIPHGPFDLIVHVAGITHQHSPKEATPEEMLKYFTANCLSAHEITRRIVTEGHMGQDNPHIVIVSTNHVGKGASGNHPTYAASKAALEQLSPTYVLAFADKKIRCNVVKPGWTLSSRQLEADKRREISLEEVAASMPTGRINDPEDVGRVVMSFEGNPSLNGAIVDLDNGVGAKFPGVVEKCD